MIRLLSVVAAVLVVALAAATATTSAAASQIWYCQNEIAKVFNQADGTQTAEAAGVAGLSRDLRDPAVEVPDSDRRCKLGRSLYQALPQMDWSNKRPGLRADPVRAHGYRCTGRIAAPDTDGNPWFWNWDCSPLSRKRTKYDSVLISIGQASKKDVRDHVPPANIVAGRSRDADRQRERKLIQT